MNTEPQMRPPLDKKTNRVAQACIRCQEKKRRCDGNTPICSPCLGRGEDCSYKGFRRTRGLGKSKQQIKALEERLSEMESLFRRSDSVQQNGSYLGSSSATELVIEGSSVDAGPSFNAERYDGLGKDRPKTSSQCRLDLFIDHHRRNGLATTSPTTHLPRIKQITERLNQYRSAGNLTQPLRHNFQSVITPSPAEINLVSGVLNSICQYLPLFHRETFLSQLHHPHALDRHGANTAWWANLNTAISLSIPLKAIPSAFNEMAVYAWAFFKNAFNILPELLVTAAPQALLAMTAFMRGMSADVRTAGMLLAAAVRARQMIWSSKEDAVERDGRTRLFWVGYVLDADMAGDYGLPALHSIDGVEDCPSEKTPNGYVSVFSLRAELATIQMRIRRGLYTDVALRKGPLQLLEITMELQLALKEWKSRLPVNLQPPDDGQLKSGPTTDVSILALHLVYYTCVSKIHWVARRRSIMNMTKDLETIGSNISPSHLRAMASAGECRTASRATIRYLEQMTTESFTDLWSILCYPISAAITLLTFIVENPSNAEARLDAELLDLLVKILRTKTRAGYDLANVLKGCSCLSGLAKDILGEAEVDTAHSPRGNRRAIASLLGISTHPMYVARSLMSNVQNQDTSTALFLTSILGIPQEESAGYGVFVPESLKPEVYGFRFDSGSSSLPNSKDPRTG